MVKKNLKETFQNRKFKSGSYSVGVIAAAILIVIVINLIVNALPSNVTKFDLSFNQMYSLTDTTKEFLKGLEEDITVYVIAQTGAEDETVMEMLNNYKALSEHIKVETVDPILHPNFILEYTTENVSSGSLLVVSEKRYKLIQASDLYTTSMNYNTYREQITGFDGEGQITSAINYVTTNDLPVVYTLEGHREGEISEELSKLITKGNIELKTLNLATVEAVPDDAKGIIINAPKVDISKEESDKLLEYLERGGSAFVVDGYETGGKTNLNTVLNYYGIEVFDGLIVEKNGGNFFYPYPYYLAPNKEAHDITNSIIENRYNIFLPEAKGMRKADTARSSIEYAPLLTTSDSSFLRTLQNSQAQSIEKQDGDIDGPFAIGVAVSEIHDDKETKLVAYSSGYMLDDSANLQVSGSNYELVINSLGWLCEMDSSIAIEEKSFSMSSLQITAKTSTYLTILILIVIPLVILIVGFIVWLKRRYR